MLSYLFFCRKLNRELARSMSEIHLVFRWVMNQKHPEKPLCLHSARSSHQVSHVRTVQPIKPSRPGLGSALWLKLLPRGRPQIYAKQSCNSKPWDFHLYVVLFWLFFIAIVPLTDMFHHSNHSFAIQSNFGQQTLRNISSVWAPWIKNTSAWQENGVSRWLNHTWWAIMYYCIRVKQMIFYKPM